MRGALPSQPGWRPHVGRMMGHSAWALGSSANRCSVELITLNEETTHGIGSMTMVVGGRPEIVR
jgi:hypothetical protein